MAANSTKTAKNNSGIEISEQKVNDQMDHIKKSKSCDQLTCEDENSNYGFKGKEISRKRWSEAEIKRFMFALKIFGTDFTSMLPLFPGRTRKTLKLKYDRELKKDSKNISDILYGDKLATDEMEELKNSLLPMSNTKNLTKQTIAQQRVPADKRVPKSKFFCYKEIHEEDRELTPKEIHTKKIASFDMATKKHNMIVKKPKKTRVPKKQVKITPKKKQKYKRAPDGTRIKIVSSPDSSMGSDDDTNSSSNDEEKFIEYLMKKVVRKQRAAEREEKKLKRKLQNDIHKRMEEQLDAELRNPYVLYGSPLTDPSPYVLYESPPGDPSTLIEPTILY